MAKTKKSIAGNVSSTHRKNISKCIEFIGRVHDTWKVFNDFLAVSAISISNNCAPYYEGLEKEIRAEREKRYLEIIGKYNKREQMLFTTMFSELIEELQSYCPSRESANLTDVLGEMFHELNFNDAWKGQFFTPQCVCDLMGMITLGDGESYKKVIAEKKYITVNEPCCGGGATIYGLANAMNKIGLNYNKEVLVVANDIDERCVFMTYIQCSLYGIPAIVQQKDSLTNEVLSPPWFTPVFIWNSWRWSDLWKGNAGNETQN